MDPSAAPPFSPERLFRFRPLRALRAALLVAAGFTLLSFALHADDPDWLTLGGWARAAGTCLTYALLIQLTIHLLYVAGMRLIGEARFAGLRPWQRLLFYRGTPLLGLTIAMPLASMLVDTSIGLTRTTQLQTTPLGALAFMALVIAIFFGFYAIRARQLRAERQAAQARLRLLQGQMEPHFLFNTLANVVSLMEADTPRAKAMLESFTDYLRASLVSLRTAEHALGVELDLVDAYLRVVKVRMDDRLRYRIDVPAGLRALRVPALSLQPLVENAVVHGLEPSIAGGQIVIEARRAGDALVLRVSDDGVGLGAPRATPPRGSGGALDNIRERLLQSHGAGARLQIESAAPQGVRATLTLPMNGDP